jgi:histone deacetylase 6
VKSETDPNLSSWYRSNSLIYVSPDHSCWNDEEAARKVKKHRFGGVKMSEVAGLAKMMNRYLREAGEWIEEKVREREAARRAEMGGGDSDETEDEELSARVGNGGLGGGVGNGRGGGGGRPFPVV